MVTMLKIWPVRDDWVELRGSPSYSLIWVQYFVSLKTSRRYSGTMFLRLSDKIFYDHRCNSCAEWCGYGVLSITSTINFINFNDSSDDLLIVSFWRFRFHMHASKFKIKKNSFMCHSGTWEIMLSINTIKLCGVILPEIFDKMK